MLYLRLKVQRNSRHRMSRLRRLRVNFLVYIYYKLLFIFGVMVEKPVKGRISLVLYNK